MSIFSISFSLSYATTGKALFSLMCQNFIHCSMFLPVCFQRIPDQITCVDVSFLTISLVFRTNSTVLGCAGFHGDCLTLTKVITARLQVCTQQLFCRLFQYHPRPKMYKLTGYKLCPHVYVHLPLQFSTMCFFPRCTNMNMGVK